MTHSLLERSVQAVYIDRDRYYSEGNDAQIPVEFFASDSSPGSFEENQIIKIEVDTEEQHEYAYDGFKVRIVIVTYAGTMVGESARTCSSEYIDEAVK